MFISRLSCVLFGMFLASQTLANLLAIILNSLFFLSHAVSKRLCLPCPIFPLCPMLCIGKPQVGVKNFFLSTMSLSSDLGTAVVGDESDDGELEGEGPDVVGEVL